jgi:hypothetical protein
MGICYAFKDIILDCSENDRGRREREDEKNGADKSLGLM